jgi:hypothetical protein
MLRRQVATRERTIRSALLAGLVPVNISYASELQTVPAKEMISHGAVGASFLHRAVDSLMRYVVNDPLRAGEAPVATAGHNDLVSIGELVISLENKRLVVLGRPGAGKTILAIELVLQLLRKSHENTAADQSGSRIPVRFSAASWLPGQDIREWMAQRLTLDYAVQPAVAQQLVGSSCILPVLDGLDELDRDPVDATPVRALALLAELNAYGEFDRPGPVIVTCRVERYEQILAAGGALFADQTIMIAELVPSQVRNYLHARYASNQLVRSIWDEVLDKIDEPSGCAARSVLSTPWRLLLAVTAAEAGHDPRQVLAVGVDEDVVSAEQRIVNDLLASYIPAAARLSPLPGRKSGCYEHQKVEHWMRGFARHLAWQADYVDRNSDSPVGMSGIDLAPHLIWPMGGVRLVRAVNAVLVLLPGIAIIAIYVYATIFLHEKSGFRYFPAYLSNNFAIVIFIVSALAFASGWAARRWPIPSISARVSLAGLAARLGVGIGAGLVVGLFGVAIYAAAGRHILGLEHLFPKRLPAGLVGLKAGLLTGIAVGIPFAIVLVLIGRSWKPDTVMVSPMHALRREPLVASVASLAVALTLLLLSTSSIAIKSGPLLKLASSLSLMFMVVLGFAPAWMRFIAGWAVTAARRRLPARLSRFMKWACDSGLLRISGATYQFRHRELQDWLLATNNRTKYK